MRGRVTAVINQKGGVGKSTTALHLAAGLSGRGMETLAVDLDSQGNLSHTAGATEEGPTVLGVLTREHPASAAIQHTACGYLLPYHTGLIAADSLITATGKEYRLKEALEPLLERYAHIVIDTPPALGLLTVNALTAADGVVIPAQADIYSIAGIHRLAETLAPVRKYCNPGLRIDGVLLTRFSANTVVGRKVAELAGRMAEGLGTRLFRARIRDAVAVRESQIARESLFTYAPGAKVTGDYRDFVAEFLEVCDA